MNNPNPKARRDDLLIEELATELLVYDQRSHRAHCLNGSAASVFRSADGNRSVTEIAKAASDNLHASFGEDLTWLALEELDKNDLLESPLARTATGPSRRDILSGGTVAAALLPLVLAITAPTPASAQSVGPSLLGSTAAAPGGEAGPFR
jgi:hypothetical protein